MYENHTTVGLTGPGQGIAGLATQLQIVVDHSFSTQPILKNVCQAVYTPVMAATDARPAVPPGS